MAFQASKNVEQFTIIIADSAIKVGVKPGVLRFKGTEAQTYQVANELGLADHMIGVWRDEASVDDLVHRFNDYVKA